MTDISILISNPALAGASAAGLLLFSVWIVSLVIRDASIIDMFWGGGFAVIAATCLLVSENLSPAALALAACNLVGHAPLAAFVSALAPRR